MTPNTRGRVIAVETEGEPVYVVEFEGEENLTGRFRRDELSYIVGQKAPPE